MNDAECFFKLYGTLIFSVPFYIKNFDCNEVVEKMENLK
jgi:hypothetical protein